MILVTEKIICSHSNEGTGKKIVVSLRLLTYLTSTEMWNNAQANSKSMPS